MDIGTMVTIGVAAISATWVLRSKLGDLEVAFKDHDAKDAAKFRDLGAKIIKLEGRATKRR